MNCGVGIAIEAVIMSLLDEHEVGDLDAIQVRKTSEAGTR
jgi:hypothetical protein